MFLYIGKTLAIFMTEINCQYEKDISKNDLIIEKCHCFSSFNVCTGILSGTDDLCESKEDRFYFCQLESECKCICIK